MFAKKAGAYQSLHSGELRHYSQPGWKNSSESLLLHYLKKRFYIIDDNCHYKKYLSNEEAKLPWPFVSDKLLDLEGVILFASKTRRLGVLHSSLTRKY